MSADQLRPPGHLTRRELLGAFAVAGSGLFLPQGAAAKDSPQPLEVPINEIVIPPEFETFRSIINNSLDANLLAPFLRQMYERLSKDPFRYFGKLHEPGYQQVTSQFIYRYGPNGGEPSLELYVQDTGENVEVPSYFTLDLHFGRNVRAVIGGQEEEILLEVPSLFTSEEQEAILGVFKTTPLMGNRLWLPRLDALKIDGTPFFTDGIPGITRGYYEDGSLISQTATILGKASIQDVYLPPSNSA